ncbi:MAG: hypothetical protein Q9227_008212 [Pyrenula ochraceoflavens]
MATNEDHIAQLDELLSRTHGTVLEIGPGGGDQMVRYKPVASKITHFYAAEPNAHLHGALLRKMEAAGIPKSKVTIFAAGAESNTLLPGLESAGLIPTKGRIPEGGCLDTIVTIKSMCSSDPGCLYDTVTVLQGLLKPGGRYLWFEHLRNDRDIVTLWFAKAINAMWSFFLGGCRLDGRLDEVCKQMGGWKEAKTKEMPWFQGYEIIRFETGNFEKA